IVGDRLADGERAWLLGGTPGPGCSLFEGETRSARGTQQVLLGRFLWPVDRGSAVRTEHVHGRTFDDPRLGASHGRPTLRILSGVLRLAGGALRIESLTFVLHPE